MYRLIEQLPWDSAYHRALADDEEIAEQVLAGLVDTEDELGPSALTLAQWDPLAELRVSIVDALMAVQRTIIAVNTPKGKKVPEFKPQPRPVSAIDRVQKAQRDASMNELLRLVEGRND